MRIFHNLLIKHDLVLLSETHCKTDEKIHIDGYECFQLNRNKTKGNNRNYGGIAVIYKCEMKKGIKFLQHKNHDYVWVKLLKTWFGFETDYYLCYAYIPPENSTFYKARGDDTLALIESDILKYSKMGHVMLCGDLNARTKNLPDFILNDEPLDDEIFPQDEISIYELDNNINVRSSQDDKVCARGQKLLSLCIAAKLRILNGRTVGDALGKYTCHKTNGSSVNDYVIVNEDILKKVLYFQVQQFMGHMSDHCSVSFSIKCMQTNNMPNNQLNENVYEFPNQYKWDRTSIIRFQQALNDNEIQMKIDKLVNAQRPNSRESVNNALQELNEIYMNAARLALNSRGW